MKENFIKVALSTCICLIAFPFLAKGQLPFSPCSPSGGKRADVLGIETKYRAPGGAAPTFTIPTGTKSIAVYVSSETGITAGTDDNDQGDEDFITINAIIDVGNSTSSGYVNYAKNTNTDGTGTNVYGWKNSPLGDTILQANKIGDALPYLNNVKFAISGNTLTITEKASGIHSSYYVEYLSPYNNSLIPLNPEIRALLHGTGATATDLSIPIPTGAEIVFISAKGTNSSSTDLYTASGTEEGYANMRFGFDLKAGTLNGFVTLANGGSVNRRSTYVISNKAAASTSDMFSSGKITGDYSAKLTSDGAVGAYNPTIYVSGSNLIIKRDANYARDFDDAYVVEFYSRVGLGMSTEFIDSDISAILDGSYTWGVKKTFTIPSGTNFIYFNETGNAINTNRESNENSLAAYGYIDLTKSTVTGYFYQQVGLNNATRRDDNYAFKNVPLDSTSTRSASGTVGFKNTGAVYDISFFLSADKSQLTVINKEGLVASSYQLLLSCDYYGSRPDVAFSTAAGITFAKGGSCNIVKATVNVCNPGSGNSSGGMPVSFYSGDPTTDPAAILLYTGTFNQDIPQGECRSFDFNLDLSSFSNVNIPLSMVLNDNGSFVSGGVGHAVGTPFTLSSLVNQGSKYKECYYDNNLISAQIAVNNCPVVNLDTDGSSGASYKNFINYFAAGSATGANIADNDVVVSDPDGDNISSAKIVLTNDKNGSAEYLVVNGAMPAGITVTGANTDTIRLTGVASAAAYADALKLIQYMNTLGSPNTTTRTITVEVNDGKETGPASTTSIYILTTPRVSVSGNGQTIADNKISTSTTDGTNYGVLTTTGGAVGNTFTVQNIGTGIITLTGTPQLVTIAGDAGFTVSSQPAGTSISSGGGLGFVVTFNPASHAIGTYTAVVTIKNNDSNTDRATYYFTVTAVVNNLPAVADNSVSGAEDAALAFTAANFTSVYTDPDGTALSKIKILSLPLNGSFKMNGTNITVGQEIVAADLSKIVFTPTSNWNGTTCFQWNAADGTSYATTAATMTIDITPVNDGPTMSLPTGLAVTEDTPASLKDVSFADVDAGTGAVTASFSVPTGWFNTATVAGVTVTGTGGSISLSGTLSAINTYIAGGNLTYSASHTPPAAEIITVTIADNGNTGAGGTKTATGTISLGITAVNDVPYGPDTNEEIEMNKDLVSKVTATDLDGDAITFTKSTNPAHGTVTVNGDGTYLYKPATGYVGIDSFKVAVSDGKSSSIITVHITVKKVNHAPVAVDDAVPVVEDTAKDFDVVLNDTDGDGDVLTASVVVNPVHGTVTQKPDGSFTYTPGTNYNGLDTMRYSLCDNGVPSMCDTGMVVFTVAAVNDAPVAVDDAVPVVEDVAKDFDVLVNDSDVEGDVLTAGVVVNPVHGTVTQKPDGSFTYTPDANYNGVDSIKYKVCDNGTPSMCDTGTVIFTVSPVNDAPVAVDDAVMVVEDVAKDFDVLVNDSDVEGDVLTAGVVVNPVHGTVTQKPDGSFTYTPDANYNGVDSIKYKVCDNGTPSMCDTGTVIFTVSPVNDAPVAVNDAVNVTEDIAKDFEVLSNDTDVEGDVLTATVLVNPVHGTVTQKPDGSFTYTPDANYNGVDSIKYKVCDNGTPSMCDTGTVIFTVTPVNDAPVAVNDAVNVTEDTSKDFEVLSNDTDVEGDVLTATVLVNPVHGTVNQKPDGSFTYTPDANYNGVDSIKYKVCDNGTPSMCDTGTVIFTVSPVNDAPVAVNDAVNVTEDVAKDFDVLLNDSDVEGDVLTASVVVNPVHGTVTQKPDGSFTYTPDANYNGVDSMTYRVCDNGTPSMCDTGTVTFTVSPVNDAPVAVNDAVNVTEDIAKDFEVLSNDTDVEGDVLTATVLVNPVHGTVTQKPDGSFTYTPDANYNGVDSIKYKVCDNGTPSMCDTGTVIFTVSPVNDAPVAVNDAVNVTEDTAKDFDVLSNDTDVEGDVLTATVLVNPVHGTVTQKPDGSFTYTPDANYNGVDSIKYNVCDNGTPSKCDIGTVIFTVSPVNDAPVAVNDAVNVTEDIAKDFDVLSNDTDVEGDVLTATVLVNPVHGTVNQKPDGSFTYTPNANYNGVDSIKYKVCDNGTPSMCDTGTVIFTVSPVNDAPVAVNDAVNVTEDTAKDFEVLSNDTDVEGDVLTATVVVNPVHGTVTQKPDGSFTYTPDANYNGADSIKYNVCDNGTPSKCDIGTVIFTVSPVNDAPVAVNDAVNVTEDTAKDFEVLSNDTDVEGDVLTATVVVNPVHGTVTQKPDGSFAYTPDANYNGADSIKYNVCDNGTPSKCDIGTVIFTVSPVNDAPVAVNDAVNVTEDIAKDFEVLSNDTDVEGDVLTATVLVNPVHGTVTQKPDGSFTYTPDANYNGVDSIKYKVCDNGTPSMCDTGVVIFTVSPVNDAPVAVNDAVMVVEDTAKDFEVLSNDTDVEGDVLTATVLVNPVHGTVTQKPDGSFTYTPDANYNGVDSIKYKVCDNGTPSMCDTGTVTFTVTPVNDAPVAVNDAVNVTEDIAKDFEVLSNDTDVEGDVLTATVLVNPVHGTVTQKPDGSFTYTPDANYNGADSIKYNVCDNGTPSKCDIGTVIFTVSPVNDAPVAVNDAVNVTEDMAKDFEVLSNDTDVEGDVLTAALLVNPVHGTVTQKPDGSFTYTPDANYNGVDSIKYKVCDNGTPSKCDTGTVIFTVSPVNDAPVAVNDAVNVTEDIAKDFEVLSNDTDVEGDVLTATVLVNPVHGTVTQKPDGSFTYTPDANYNGADSIKYNVCDNGTPSKCDIGTVIFTVSPVNDAPVAVNDAVNVTEDIAKDFEVLSNDTDVDGDVLTATVLVNPVHGTVTQKPDGSFTYTPDANYNGADSIKYNVCDNGTPSKCDIGTVIFTVSPVNDAPVAVNDAVNVTEDTAKDFEVLSNDTDVEGDVLTATVVLNPVHGTVTQKPDGSFTYTPDANYNGADSIKYNVCDNGTPSKCDIGTVIFTVSPVNDAPVAVNDAVNVTEDIAKDFEVLSNDTDVEGDVLTATVLVNPVHGTVTQKPDGSFTYTPDANYNGADSIKYNVCDNGTPSKCDIGTVIFTVSPVNDAPVAVNDAVNVTEDMAKDFEVLSNDTDVEGDVLTAALLVNPVHGTVTQKPDGSFTYTPDANYNGVDSIKYKVCDNGTPSKCDTGTVIFTVSPVNDAPVAVNDAVNVTEDIAKDFEVLSNDTDVEGDVLTATVLVNPVHGTVTQKPDGSFTYTPDANYNGADSIKYNVCDNGTPSKCDIGTVIFTVSPVNDAPVAVNDAVNVTEDIAKDFEVLSNDTDVDGDVLTATVLVNPVHGTVTQKPDGSFTYTPDANYNGVDSIKYKVCDNGTPSKCDIGTVTFTVTPVNDAPVAVNDAVNVTEDIAKDFEVLSNDTDVEGDVLTATVLVNPVHGTVTQKPDGSFTYTPDANYNGADSIKYNVCDNGTPSKCDIGTVIFTVSPVNDAPVAVNDAVNVTEDIAKDFEVLSNDTDVEGDVLTATVLVNPVHGTVTQKPDGSFTYTPDPNYNGVDSIKYKVCDNGTPSKCDIGTVTFTVTPVNDAPVAVNDAVNVTEDIAKDFEVLSNDTDVEGDVLTATVLVNPVHGTVTQKPDGSFTYTPDANYNGADSIKYKVCDNGTPSKCDIGTVIFTVSPVNDAPVAVNDAVNVTEDTAKDFEVLSNDTDVEGDVLTAIVLVNPVHGTVTQKPDGSFTYTPDANYNGADSIKYNVCDNGTPSKCDIGTVTFIVSPVNDAPVAVNDAVNVTEDIAKDFEVLSNDTDVEGDVLTATVLVNPVHGTVTQKPDGSFTYTPDANYNGVDSIKYKVCDNGTPSMCDTGTVIFTVSPVNDAPVAVNDAVNVTEDIAKDFEVLSNDTDVEGDVLTATVLVNPVHGTVTQKPDGSFTYTPDANYNGADSIKYNVCDNGTPSKCDIGTVTFIVSPVNDAPIAVDDAATLAEGTSANGNVLTNDYDVDGDALTASLLTPAVNGTATLDGNGHFTYTPNPNFSGKDSIVYQTCDNGTPGLCNTAVVIFTVTAINHKPIAVDDAITSLEDETYSGNVLTNDSDPDGDEISASIITLPVHGTASLTAEGIIVYTPDPNFNGKDSLVYMICDNGTPGLCDAAVVRFTVTPVNDVPVITGGDKTTTEQGKPVKDTLTATDPDGDPLTYSKGSEPAHGSVNVDDKGTYTYTPDPGFTGDDTFTVIVDDGSGNPKTVTVTVTVTPPTTTNHPPVVNGGYDITTEQDKPVKDTLTATDPDGDPLTFDKGSKPAHGDVVVDKDGTYTYTPDPGYTGTDTFTIIVDDGHGDPKTVTVTVDVKAPTTTNNPPVVTGGTTTTTEQDKPVKDTLTATDPEGGPLTYEKGSDPTHGSVKVDDDGTYTYTPDPGYTGDDTFTIIVKDDKGNTTAVTVTVTVTTPNKAPVVTGGTTTTTEQDKPVKDTLTATDPEGGPLTYEKGSDPTHGSVKVDDDGTYTYTPDPGYTGDDAFTIIVKDDKGNTTTVTVAVKVTIPDNSNNPLAFNDSITVVANTPIDIDVLANDSARTSTFDPGSVRVVDQPAHGSVVVNSNGTVTYTPATGYTGEDTFTYQVTTADGKTTNIATVKISTSFAEITVPTLFTPNGDGRNDVFEIRGLSQYAETELIIVNRWGNEVFRSKNYQNTWKGEGLNEGTYYYLLRIRRTASSGWEVIKGYTTLVRNFNN